MGRGDYGYFGRVLEDLWRRPDRTATGYRDSVVKGVETLRSIYVRTYDCSIANIRDRAMTKHLEDKFSIDICTKSTKAGTASALSLADQAAGPRHPSSLSSLLVPLLLEVSSALPSGGQ